MRESIIPVTLLMVVYTGMINEKIIEWQGSTRSEMLWIGGLTEPLLTKFLPAILILTGGIVMGIVGLFILSLIVGLESSINLVIIFVIVGMVAAVWNEVTDDISLNAWHTGVLGGLTVGVSELYIRNFVFSPDFSIFFWKMATYDPVQLIPVFLHTIEGAAIITATVLWKTNRTNRWIVYGMILLFTGFHISWNWMVMVR